MPIKTAALVALVVTVAAIAAVAGETPPRPEPRVLRPTADPRSVTENTMRRGVVPDLAK